MNFSRIFVAPVKPTLSAARVDASLDAQRATVVPLVDADHLRMNPGTEGCQHDVFGDPSKPGMYVIRNRFAPGTRAVRISRSGSLRHGDQGHVVTAEGDVFRPDR